MILTPVQDKCLSMNCLATVSGNVSILAPPVNRCFRCDRSLIENHHCTVKLYTLRGVSAAYKVTLRCTQCSTIYNNSMWGDKHRWGYTLGHQWHLEIVISTLHAQSQGSAASYSLTRSSHHSISNSILSRRSLPSLCLMCAPTNQFQERHFHWLGSQSLPISTELRSLKYCGIVKGDLKHQPYK